ncbi:Uncharacterised protein [Bordetella pertussis]|nr:Uncharacterised protein [Bordetella pertussis]CPN73439.1 Uncharacterised protein [Bordetella pertussis]
MPTPPVATTMRQIASKLRTWMRSRMRLSSRALSSARRVASEVAGGSPT